MDENTKFDQIVDRRLKEYFKRNPRMAVKLGKEEYEKVVESGTKEHLEENLNWFTKWINELKELKTEKLNFENQISLKTLEYYHNINLFMHEAFPLWKKLPNGLEYFQETSFLLFQRKGATTDVAEAIIAHLTNLPKYLAEFQSRFDKTPIPIVWRDLALEQIQMTPKFLLNLIKVYSETSEVLPDLKDRLVNAIKESESAISPHLEWIKSLPVDKDEFAWALGPEKFDKLLDLRKLPWDRKLILKKGTKEFNNLYKKVVEIAKEINPNKPLNEVIIEFFKQDKISNFQEVLEYARSEAERAKKFIESHNLATIPQESLSIIETPPHLIQTISSAAYYEAPYYSKYQPGVYMITPAQNEGESTIYSYTTLANAVVHEAYPGHHLDFACNNEFAPITRLMGDALETIEGWAHYCEEMMLKQEFHKDLNKAKFLVTGGQLFRAMRINLDIQLHCKQRTIEEAIQMLMNILQMGETEARTEILRYTSTPAYQLSYLVGKLLINDLLSEVEEIMGPNFSLKFFHDTILRSGDLPYYLLKVYFEEKIKKL